MKTNVGQTDKFIRVFSGMVALGLGVVVHWGFYFLAVALIVTAFTGFCGIYTLFGISTCPRKITKK
jgi:hypothetical protein